MSDRISQLDLAACSLRPGSVVSVWDMLRFNASAFYDVAGWLHRIEGISTGAGKDSSAVKMIIPPDNKASFLKNFAELRSHLEIMGASLTIMSVDRLVRKLESKDLTYGAIAEAIEIINGRLYDELSLVSLYVFDKNKAEYFGTPSSLFGSEVSDSFPSAIPDIEDASRCLACAQGTAAVFHLMRIMEVGLKALAARLEIPHLPSWESHIAQILKKISAPHKEKEESWRSIEPYCRDIMGDLQVVKVAWRNPTMHVVRRYTAEEAEAIFRAVKAFMTRLSLELQEQPDEAEAEQPS